MIRFDIDDGHQPIATRTRRRRFSSVAGGLLGISFGLFLAFGWFEYPLSDRAHVLAILFFSAVGGAKASGSSTYVSAAICGAASLGITYGMLAWMNCVIEFALSRPITGAFLIGAVLWSFLEGACVGAMFGVVVGAIGRAWGWVASRNHSQ